MKVKIFLLLVCFIIFSSNALAQSNFNISMPSAVGPEQTISASLDFNLKNIDSKTKVIIEIKNVGTTPPYYKRIELSLLEFLERLGVQKNCDPADCSSRYITSKSFSEKTFEMQQDSEALFAFRIPSGQNIEIQNLSFKITGSTQGTFSCEDSIIKMDLLDDNAIDWEYTAFAEEKNCSGFITGCFLNINTQDIILDLTPRCEKIKIGKTGKADLGVYVNAINENYGTLMLLLYDPMNGKKYNCTIEEAESGFNYCRITFQEDNFFINESREVFVCVLAFGGTYTIKFETDSPCGFFGDPEERRNFDSDYPIYLRYYGFSSMNEEITFDEETFVGNLQNYLQNYITARYNRNCNNGCVIPVRLIAKSNQSIKVSEPFLKYSHSFGSAFNNHFFEAQAIHAKVNVSQQASLAPLNISSPQREGNYTLNINIGTIQRSINFNVARVPVPLYVYPLFVVPGRETKFRVIVEEAASEVVSYTWKWGDNTEETTNVPEAFHTYSQGTFLLTIIVKDASGLQGSKSFTIVSNITRELLNQTLTEKKVLLQNASTLFEPWYSALFLNFTELNNTLNNVALQLYTADPLLLKQQLDSAKIPVKVSTVSFLQESPYLFDVEKVDLEKIEEISEKTFTGSEEKFLAALDMWQQKNITLKFASEIKKVYFDDGTEMYFTILTIKLLPSSEEELYFVFETPAGIQHRIKTKENLQLEQIGNALAMKFSKSSTITFAIPTRLELQDVVFYVSPSFEALDVREEGYDYKKRENKSFIVLLGIIIAIGVVVALFFIWKQPKKKPLTDTDLAKLINFITISLSQGIQRKQIEEQLLAAGWTKKQVAYAFKQAEKKRLA
ncbi:MAG: PKD domain-containing protein [Candidatus Pacearchaeota archaeon]|nr:PKD domain-containing protein [Candidatus Pacearchaeota archaeon]